MKTVDGFPVPRVLGFLRKHTLNLFVLLVVLHLPLTAAAAQSVRLAWDPSPDPSAAGYLVHYGTASGSPTQHLDVGMQTMAQVAELREGATYYFSVTAYTASRIESKPSNEIAYQVPALPVGVLRLKPGPSPGIAPRLQITLEPGQQFEIRASKDLRTWTTLHTGISPAGGVIHFTDPQAAQHPHRFYRLATVPRALASVLDLEPALSGNTKVQLHYSVRAGLPYGLQASEDLRHWTTLAAGVSTTATWQHLVDPASATLPQRFYRIIHP